MNDHFCLWATLKYDRNFNNLGLLSVGKAPKRMLMANKGKDWHLGEI